LLAAQTTWVRAVVTTATGTSETPPATALVMGVNDLGLIAMKLPAPTLLHQPVMGVACNRCHERSSAPRITVDSARYYLLAISGNPVVSRLRTVEAPIHRSPACPY
jgi:hypothetical protein